VLSQALGEEASKAAFASREPGHLDNTHRSPYGAYQIARLVADGIRQAGLPVAGFLPAELAPANPARPGPFSAFRVPPSYGEAAERSPETRTIDDGCACKAEPVTATLLRAPNVPHCRLHLALSVGYLI
jgi:hypothetical protein